MPYSERKGSLFEADDLDAIAHGVNCRGVMGAGIAKEFARRYPEMKQVYRRACEERTLNPGDCWPYPVYPTTSVVFNLATQDRPGPDAKMRWVAHSIAEMVDQAESLGLKRVGLPRIGCGIGGLEWVEVRIILEMLANESSVELVVFSL